MDSVEQLLLNDERVTKVTTFIGTSSPRFHTVYAPKMPAPNFGQLLVNTVSNQATKDIVRDYESTYSNRYPNAFVNWRILAMQFTPSPIEIRIQLKFYHISRIITPSFSYHQDTNQITIVLSKYSIKLKTT